MNNGSAEILEAEKRVENVVVSLMACQLEVDGEASVEAAAASAAAQHLLTETFPSVLMLLRADDDAASVSVVVFLQAYVAKLKTVQKRADGLSKVSPEPFFQGLSSNEGCYFHDSVV
jgi:hypothetical protein